MNSVSPLVTIITPSYNHAQYISRAIESVFSQTYKNLEYIIIDDGSTDNSHAILKDLQKKYPTIHLILHDENKGHVRLNEGIQMAKGQFISFLSSDDWYLPEKIEKQMKLFAALPDSYGVVYSEGYRYFQWSGEMIITRHEKKRGYILKDMLTHPAFIYPITPLVRRQALIDYPFLEGYKAEGEGVYFRIAIKYLFDYVDEPLVVMRDHSYNTGKAITALLTDNINLINQLFSNPEFPITLQKYKSRKLSNTYYICGWHLIRIQKDFITGKKYLTKSFQYSKRIVFKWRWSVGYCIILLQKWFSKKK